MLSREQAQLMIIEEMSRAGFTLAYARIKRGYFSGYSLETLDSRSFAKSRHESAYEVQVNMLTGEVSHFGTKRRPSTDGYRPRPYDVVIEVEDGDVLPPEEEVKPHSTVRVTDSGVRIEGSALPRKKERR